MDTQMSKEEFEKVLRLFGKARDSYAKLGDNNTAAECDSAIALAQRIALDPRI